MNEPWPDCCWNDHVERIEHERSRRSKLRRELTAIADLSTEARESALRALEWSQAKDDRRMAKSIKDRAAGKQCAKGCQCKHTDLLSDDTPWVMAINLIEHDANHRLINADQTFALQMRANYSEYERQLAREPK